MEAPWKAEIEGLLSLSPVHACVTVMDPVAGEELHIRDREPIHAASLIKLPLMWELYAEAEQGLLSLNEEIPLRASEQIVGGLLHKFLPGMKLRLEDYAMFMGTVSDNTACNVLAERIGISRVTERAHSLGMEDTRMERKMMDLASRRAGKDNWTTALDVALFFKRLLFGPGLSKTSRDRIISILCAQKSQNKIASGIPCADIDDRELLFAHKTGEIHGCEHDAGIMFPFGRPLIVSVLTKGLDDRMPAVDLCRKLGGILYRAQSVLQ